MKNSMGAYKIIDGYLAGQIIDIEDNIQNMGEDFGIRGKVYLPELAMRGSWAARNALDLGKYTITDEPFFYGKIGNLGYIVAEKDLEIP